MFNVVILVSSAEFRSVNNYNTILYHLSHQYMLDFKMEKRKFIFFYMKSKPALKHSNKVAKLHFAKEHTYVMDGPVERCNILRFEGIYNFNYN